MNIKKQIRTLYIYEMISGLQIVDLVWVLFLIQRGFSLAEAGIAEGVFHVVSMCCEIPSGMLSDLIGRKKTLAAAGIVSALSAFCMIVTDFFPMILLAMGLNALSYNLVSGTREALTYDSLLEAGAEDQYLKVSSRQESIYQGLYAVTGLISVITVSLGYRLAYLLPVIVAAGAANCMNEMTALRLENENQREAASEIRATIISVGSMMYSVWMAVLSPVCGAAANAFSVPAAFFGLGILMIVLTCIYTVREK